MAYIRRLSLFISRHSGTAQCAWLAVFAAAACGGVRDDGAIVQSVSSPVQTITIDARRSLVVTDQPILDRFPLKRVLDQLVAQSGVPGLTSLSLFRQWWDTQNPGPGIGAGPHCDDTVDPTLGPVLNGFPYLCRAAPAEGAQAACDPFTDPVNSPCAYIPIGLFNRFDLAPEDGSHCGEYRIVYAKRTGTDPLVTNDRNLLIFEAAMLNPLPNQGIKGCRKIVDVWANLTSETSLSQRADELERFYFNGSGNVPPVVQLDHYGDNALGVGQVRSNQFSLTTTGWSLREFQLLRTCVGSSCTAMRFVPVTVKNNAYGPLFSAASTHPSAAAFQAFFPSQVPTLVADTQPGIDIAVTNTFNSGQSQASGTTADEMKYPLQFGTATSPLRTAVQAQLTSIGSTLTPDDVVKRAQTQTCAGCHRLTNNVDLGGGLTWPASLGFTHVTERETEVVDGVTRYRISDALVNVLLPHRKDVVEEYLNNMPHNPKGPKVPLIGHHNHG